MAAHGSLEPFVLVRVQVGEQKGLCLGGYSDPLDMTGPSPPIRTGTLSDTARPNPSPTTEILPCGRPFLRDLLDSTVQGGNRLCSANGLAIIHRLCIDCAYRMIRSVADDGD